MFRESLVVAIVAVASLVSCHTVERPVALDLPPLMLWAWERPEDLRFIDCRKTGVAFLAETVAIAGDGSLHRHSRMNPLRLPPAAQVEAVVRIESVLQHAAVDLTELTAVLAKAAALPRVRALQIDFDARQSERELYRQILARLQSAASVPISLTALASWCAGDEWLHREPVAEAVPMLFRMGRVPLRETTFAPAVCSGAVGLSTDEAWPSHRPRRVHRVYLFSPHAWTADEYGKALARLENWE